MSQIRASGGTATSARTFSINPSRIKTVAESSTSPGLTTTLPPTRAWTPSGTARLPGGRISARAALSSARQARPIQKIFRNGVTDPARLHFLEKEFKGRKWRACFLGGSGDIFPHAED